VVTRFKQDYKLNTQRLQQAQQTIRIITSLEMLAQMMTGTGIITKAELDDIE
jgi:hypothetical protein